MSNDKKNSKIISLDAFREAQRTNMKDDATSCKAPQEPTDPPYEIFYDLLSVPALTQKNRPVAMRHLLQSLNSQFALAAQKSDLPENAGMYNAHLSLTQLSFSEETVNEIGESFARQWREKKTARLLSLCKAA